MIMTTAAPPRDPPQRLPRHRPPALRRGARHPRHRPRLRRATGSCPTSATGSRRRRSRASWRRELGKLGVLGMHLEGYGCAGASATAYGLACMELEAGDSGDPQPRLGPGLAGDVRDLALGLGGAEAGVAAADGRGRGDRLLRPDRARLRLRPRLDAHPRPPRRRRLDPPRPEDVDHQRLDRRRRRRLGARPTRASAASSSRSGTPGFTTQDIHRKLSLRASVTSELLLDDVRLPADARAARGDARCAGPLSCLNEARYGIVWGAAGAARACFEAALELQPASASSSTGRSPRSRSSSRSWRRWRSRSTGRRCWRCTSAG